MTREDVIQYWEQFDAEIDDIYDSASEEERTVLYEQRKMVELTISDLRQQEHRCPCDLCDFGPPSSMRGNPCTMCPAVPRQERNDPLTLDEIREAAETGDPVWLVGMEDGDGWVRIDGVYSLTIGYSRFGDTETWCFRKASYGVRVWAYHQKPEEENRHG